MKLKEHLEIKSKLKMFPSNLNKKNTLKRIERTESIKLNKTENKKNYSMNKNQQSNSPKKLAKLNFKRQLTKKEIIERAVKEVRAEKEQVEMEKVIEEEQISPKTKLQGRRSFSQNIQTSLNFNKTELNTKIEEIKKNVFNEPIFRPPKTPNRSQYSYFPTSKQETFYVSNNSFFNVKSERPGLATTRHQKNTTISNMHISKYDNFLNQSRASAFNNTFTSQTARNFDNIFKEKCEYNKLRSEVKSDNFTAEDSYCFQKAMRQTQKSFVTKDRRDSYDEKNQFFDLKNSINKDVFGSCGMSKEALDRLKNAHMHYQSRKTGIGIYELKEQFPVKISFVGAAKSALIKIDSRNKVFPIHLNCEQRDHEFNYYVNFSDRPPTESVCDVKFENYKGRLDLMPNDLFLQLKYSDTMTVYSNNKESKIGCVYIQIESVFYETHCIFSYSFSNLKYILSKGKKEVGIFTDEQKMQLFDIQKNYEGPLEYEVNRQLKLIQNERKKMTRHMVIKNKQDVIKYDMFRSQKMDDSKKNHEERMKQAKSKHISLKKADLQKKIEFNEVHEKMKLQMYLTRMEKENKLFHFMFCYGWTYYIQMVLTLQKYKACVNQVLEKVYFHRKKIDKANQLQEFLRRKLDSNHGLFKFEKLRSLDMNKLLKKQRDSNYTSYALKIFCKKAKFSIRKRAIIVVSKFTNIMSKQWRLRDSLQQFILGIKNIQRRWRKFIKYQRFIQRHISEKWDKEQFSISNWIAEYQTTDKKHYETLNIETLFTLTTSTRDILLPYLVNRHLIYYTERKYSKLMTRQDEKIRKKAATFGRKEQSEVNTPLSSLFAAFKKKGANKTAKDHELMQDQIVEGIAKYYEMLVDNRPTIIPVKKEPPIDPYINKSTVDPQTTPAPKGDITKSEIIGFTSLVRMPTKKKKKGLDNQILSLNAEKLSKMNFIAKSLNNFDSEELSPLKQVNRKIAKNDSGAAIIMKALFTKNIIDMGQYEHDFTQQEAINRRRMLLKQLTSIYNVQKNLLFDSQFFFNIEILWESATIKFTESEDLWLKIIEILPTIYNKIFQINESKKSQEKTTTNKRFLRKHTSAEGPSIKRFGTKDLKPINEIEAIKSTCNNALFSLFQNVTEEEVEINEENPFEDMREGEKFTVDEIDQKIFGSIKMNKYSVKIRPKMMKAIIVSVQEILSGKTVIL